MSPVKVIAHEGLLLVYTGYDVGDIDTWERHGRVAGEPMPTPSLQLDEEDAAELSIRLARAVYQMSDRPHVHTQAVASRVEVAVHGATPFHGRPGSVIFAIDDPAEAVRQAAEFLRNAIDAARALTEGRVLPSVYPPAPDTGDVSEGSA